MSPHTVVRSFELFVFRVKTLKVRRFNVSFRLHASGRKVVVGFTFFSQKKFCAATQASATHALKTTHTHTHNSGPHLFTQDVLLKQW